MKTVGLITEERRGVDNACHLRFMALLYALVRENGKQEFQSAHYHLHSGMEPGDVIATQSCYNGVT